MREERYTNHLIHEKSPYLKQHAHNPVNWYPWAQEPFDKALAFDRLIFLSIGYATCHYCHVMEREAFSNIEIAKILNEHYVCIKVDREELPEVDSFYIESASFISEGGIGWPLNLILTPDLKPLYAATYLSADSNGNQIGLKDLALTFAKIWQGEGRLELIQHANNTLELIQNFHAAKGEALPNETILLESIDYLLAHADPLYGGSEGAPKFPLGYQLSFLLSAYKCEQDARLLYYVEKTLDMMARGGIYDHVGGGFSRYSVDEKWFFPHFEKLLCDNALLADVYCEAWQVTKKPYYKEIACEIADYVIRDLSHNEGAFFSGQDAETEGVEGLFYTWTFQEIHQILSVSDAAIFSAYFSLSPQGNYQGRNVLCATKSLEEFSLETKIPQEEARQSLQRSLLTLRQVREERIHPLRDEIILVGWNGLMIHSLARLAFAFDRPDYLDAAMRSAHFIVNNLYQAPFLLRRFCDGEARFSAALDDYALFIRALITLFEVEGSVNWLELALELCNTLSSYFAAPAGGYFESLEEEKIFIRRQEFYDDALPCGNGIQAENLIRLYQMLGNIDFLEQHQNLLKAAKSALEDYPIGGLSLFKAFQRMKNPKSTLVVIVFNKEREHEKEIKDLLFKDYHPHLSLIIKGDQLTKSVMSLEDKRCLEGKTTLYVCTQRGCLQPLTDIKEIEEELQKF